MIIKIIARRRCLFGDGGVTQDFARTNNLGDTLKPTAKDITSVAHFSNWDFLRRHPERGTFIGNEFRFKAPKIGQERAFLKKSQKNLKKHLTSGFCCGIILSVERQCWNRQTGTFEGRVSLTYGFKSHLPHQFKLRKPPKIRGLRSFIFAKNSLWDLFGPYFSNSVSPIKS